MKLRRFLGIALCVICILSVLVLPTQVQAAETGRYTYEVHDGKATITGCTWTNASYLEIPRKIDGYPVVAIGANAFDERNDLLGVIVSEGVETIDYRAFWCCRNLRWVVLPDSLTKIEDEAFSVCTSLSSVDFGAGLKTIGYAAFSHCSNLYDTQFQEGLESIGMSAFYKCYSLESVYLPDSLKVLGARAYDSCVNLSSFYFPDTVTSIGANVLYDSACYRNSIYWYGDVFYMGSCLLQAKKTISGSHTVAPGTILIADSAFENCDNLTDLVLPDTLQTIGVSAFESCDKLQKITIPASVTTIGDEAFYWCKELTDVEFSGDVTNMGQDVFKRTPYYENGENWENNGFYVGTCLVSCKGSITGSFQVRPGTQTIGDGALQGQTKVTEVILPDTVTTIGEKAFYGCSKLQAVHLGKAVSQIGTGAFGQCASLESIMVDGENTTYSSKDNCLIREKSLVLGCKSSVIPQDGSVTAIGPYAFDSCAGLTELIIPDSITTIGEGAFQNCNALVRVKLGDGVEVVGKRAFAECDVLSQIDFGQSLHTIADFGFAYNHQIKQVEFPDSLRYLGEEAFSNSTGLVKVNFQEGLISIGKNCFIFCENLTAVHLPDSVEEVKYGAFYSCEKIASLTLGEGLITIGDTAFDGCKALQTLVIPKRVETIGSNAFYECISLSYVDLGNVKKIGNAAFESCSSLTQIHIPASVTDLGKQAFSYCTAMEQMTVSAENPYYHSQGNCIIHTGNQYLLYGCKNSIIPADGSVTVLQGYAFAGCTGLTRIEVPDQVTRIDAYTFYGCSRLEYMKLPFVGGSKNYDNYIGYIFGGGPSQNDLFVPGTLKEIVITGGTIVGDSGFKNCKWLERIVLPESITTIGYEAFANCPKLEYVIVPGDLQTIKDSGIFNGTPYGMMRISMGKENTIALVKEYEIRHQLGGLVTFVDDQDQVLSSQWYAANSQITAPSAPEKPAEENYTYEAVWEPVPDRCIGNQTICLRYVAHWTGEAVLGDLTGDGKINSLDGLLLMRYLNGWNVNITTLETMDLNGDGKVNSLDGLILMRYLNGWDVTFG